MLHLHFSKRQEELQKIFEPITESFLVVIIIFKRLCVYTLFLFCFLFYIVIFGLSGGGRYQSCRLKWNSASEVEISQ